MSNDSTLTAPASGGVNTVRRVITYLLLGVMVLIAGIGLAGLLERALTTPAVLADFGSSGLAQSLAFTLIGGPFALGLWWFAWRNLTDASADRHSAAWAVYLVVAHTISLIVFSVSALSFLADLVVGDWRPGALAIAIAWGLIWAWHHWMWHHKTSGPTRLVGAASVLGSAWGLAVFASGLTMALGTVLEAGIAGVAGSATLGLPWWSDALRSLVWAVGGALVWWWHWTVRGVRSLTTGFANVTLVFIAGIASVSMVLGGATLSLWHVVGLILRDPDWPSLGFAEVGFALATALVGVLLWVYHRPFVRTPGLAEATRLAESGVALAVAATGVGVLVNSTLSALTTDLVGTGRTSLFVSGLSALVVGALAWWFAWQPTRVPAYGRAGRRIYLVAVFGVAALVALITLLVIGFQLFVFFLEPATGRGLIDSIRVPFGLLVATGLVAWYHFAVWRGDRAVLGATAAEAPRLRQVTLITAATDVDALVAAIRDVSGATVKVWRATASAESAEGPTGEQVSAALAEVAAERVVVLAGPGSRVEVIQLEG